MGGTGLGGRDHQSRLHGPPPTSRKNLMRVSFPAAVCDAPCGAADNVRMASQNSKGENRHELSESLTEVHDAAAQPRQIVLTVSGSGAVLDVQQSCGLTAAEQPDVTIDELWPGEPADRLKIKIRRALRSRAVDSAEFVDDRDGSTYDFVFIPQGRDRVLVVTRDVSARRSAYSRLEELAYVDDATKLPNRLFLIEEIERSVNTIRLQEGRAAVLCFDIRGAERRAGAHRSGDHNDVFVELASRLTHELRGVNEVESDDAERYSVAARVDEHQFGVLLPVIDSGADAESVVKRLSDTLKQPIKLPHRDVKLSVSAGIALYPQDGTTAEALYANALAAMEDAHSMGVPYKFHSGTVRLRALQRQDLALELKSALERDEFAIEYLPCVNAARRTPCAVEALLRWPQNVFGAQSIQKVISVAENTGLILPIGDWVLRRACAALAEWHAKGWTTLRLSVNFSAQQFACAELVDRIRSILEESSVDPSMIDFEITEYVLFRDAMKGFATLSALKNLGVGVVVDDYGVGACSLAHLARSPIDALKIDNAFVANLTRGGADAAACAAMVSMARELDVRVVAEGVETEEQASELTRLGCAELQGFLFSRPLPLDAASAYLEAHAAPA